MTDFKTPSVQQRVTSLIASGALAASMLAMPAAAFAADVTPSVGAQTGRGSTDVTVQNIVGSDEHSGPKVDPSNPAADPNDPDSVGKNIAFTVPSSINFVADAQGNLTGSSKDKVYVENESVFTIRVSSFDVDPENGWTVIDDGTAPAAANSVDFQFGPADDKLDAFDYLNKSNVKKPTAWNMAPASNSGVSDRVQMETTGNIFKVDKNITAKSKVATIKTYVRAGNATS